LILDHPLSANRQDKIGKPGKTQPPVADARFCPSIGVFGLGTGSQVQVLFHLPYVEATQSGNVLSRDLSSNETLTKEFAAP